MIFNATKAFDVEKSTKKFNLLIEREGRFELTEKKGNKTPRQNRYLHLIIGWFAIESGYTAVYVKREFFKIECNIELFKVAETGCFGKMEGLKSWSELEVDDATLAITRFRNWASVTANICLPEPDDLKFLNHIEEELSKHNNKEFI
ncbi:hypothetical protein [Flavicella sp.]|uniref:hypothetical protein n=1 Tax=Flavicella sp. TaxID=2957742 RepID=UPI003015A1D5